jgi:hypothetical protein
MSTCFKVRAWSTGVDEIILHLWMLAYYMSLVKYYNSLTVLVVVHTAWLFTESLYGVRSVSQKREDIEFSGVNKLHSRNVRLVIP